MLQPGKIVEIAVQGIRPAHHGVIRKKHYEDTKAEQKCVGFSIFQRSNFHLPPVNERICYLRLQCQHISLVPIYSCALTEDSDKEEKTHFTSFYQIFFA